jgi:hypothetical protein
MLDLLLTAVTAAAAELEMGDRGALIAYADDVRANDIEPMQIRKVGKAEFDAVRLGVGPAARGAFWGSRWRNEMSGIGRAAAERESREASGSRIRGSRTQAG